MSHPVLLDTGPLVASLKAQDQFHAWAVAELDRVSSPVISCEPVITEACFLLRNTPSGEATILSLIADGLIQIPFRIEDEAIASANPADPILLCSYVACRCLPRSSG